MMFKLYAAAWQQTCRPHTWLLPRVGMQGQALDARRIAKHSASWTMLCNSVTLTGLLREGDVAPLVRTRQAAPR
jgi:hypothetical protein